MKKWYKNKWQNEFIYVKQSRPTEGLAVDASCIKGNGEVRVVDIKTNRIIVNFKIEGETTNNIAEFIAIAYGIKEVIKKHTLNKRTIYSDSTVALSWFKKRKCNSTIKVTNESQLKMIRECEKIMLNNMHIEVKFWNNKKWGETPADFGRKTNKNMKKEEQVDVYGYTLEQLKFKLERPKCPNPEIIIRSDGYTNQDAWSDHITEYEFNHFFVGTDKNGDDIYISDGNECTGCWVCKQRELDLAADEQYELASKYRDNYNSLLNRIKELEIK